MEYEVNNEFQEQATQLSEVLSLDQVESAAWLLEGQRKSDALDRPPLVCAVIQFHERRSFLVDSLRLLLKIRLDDEADEALKTSISEALEHILRSKESRGADSPTFATKCLNAMADIRQWLARVGEHAQKVAALGRVSTPDVDEIMGFQQQQLTQQHESLGSIVQQLVKAGYAAEADFRKLQDQMHQVDKWNSLAVHYVPSWTQFSCSFGSSEGRMSRETATELHQSIMESREQRPWPLRNLQAATTLFWLAEYNSWFFDLATDTQSGDSKASREATARDNALMKALHDGAFQCILSICSSCKPGDWYGSARIALIRSLLGDAPNLPSEPASISPYFCDLLMEQFESFTQSFISNMPDTLRKFKLDEEDQRKRNLASFQPVMRDDVAQHDRHLERFFVIMSYAEEGRPSAAAVFWEDPESNLYGFLQWFSRRVSTPLIGAFCEMFRSISEGEENAGGAHNFLLEDAQIPASRNRRATSLSWSQIFEELEFYASKVRESPGSAPAAPSTYPGRPKPVESNEPETPVMLECYLRLTAHLCHQSEVVRSWLLGHSTFRLLDTIFLLCHSTVPSRVRACAFTCAKAALTGKSKELSDTVWTSLDQWVSHGFTHGVQLSRPTRTNLGSANWAEEVTFDTISIDFDETVAFVSLLQELVASPHEAQLFSDALPFPEQLGSSYRMPGIEPYVDLVMGKIFSVKIPQLEPSSQAAVLASKILHFAETCLETFNERLLNLTKRSDKNFDDCLNTSSLSAYVRSHPFARMIEWFFNEKVVAVLFRLAHQDISDVLVSQEDSPRMEALQRAISIMILVMDLQSTFLDIVRPIIKIQSTSRHKPVISPAIATFEDCVSTNIRVIADLAYYCGSGNKNLALSSIELLKRFSESRKLNAAQPWNGSRHGLNRLTAVLQQNHDVEPVARALIQSMEVDERELNLGPESSEFIIKSAILNFLESTLSAHPDQPTLAHTLLGFECSAASVTISPNGLFAKRMSLFHAILDLSLEYPAALEGSYVDWCVTLKSQAAHIVQLLWLSPLTSEHVLVDMRLGGTFFAEWLRISPFDPNVRFEGLQTRDPSFLFLHGAPTFQKLLKLRSTLVSFASTELRSIAKKILPTLNTEVVGTLLGKTVTGAGEISNAAIFDLLDFLEMEPSNIAFGPQVELLAGIDLEACVDSGPGDSKSFNMQLLEQLLILTEHHFRKSGVIKDEAVEEKYILEVQEICAYANGWNNSQALSRARIETLEAWADLVTLVVINPQIDGNDRTTLVLQLFQLIAPKMEQYAYSDKPEGLVFARLTQMLFSNLDLSSDEVADGRAAEIAQARLFQLFNNCLTAITNPDASPALREALYNICYEYLTRLSSMQSSDKEILGAIVEAGDGMIDVICDDAYGSAGAVRVAASLFLACMAELASRLQDTYLVTSLSRNNFLIVLIDSIRDIPAELTRGHPQDVPLLLASFNGRLAMLLALCATAAGAGAVVAAGLFAAVAESGLFATDPDLGLGLDDPAALRRFYELVVNVLQVVVTILLSSGLQNRQAMGLVRAFLAQNRPLMVGVFKRQARVVAYEKAAAEAEAEGPLKAAAELYVLLITMTGFLEVNAYSRRYHESLLTFHSSRTNENQYLDGERSSRELLV